MRTKRKTQSVFTLYVDNGHAWAKVPREMLVQMGIVKDITHYSYQRGDYVYLGDEDGDLETFVKAYPIAITFKVVRSARSRVRSYDSYRA
jgi:hypothetical protein